MLEKKPEKNYLGFLIPKICKFWSVSLGHFIKHKPLISEEWKRTTWSFISTSLIDEYWYKKSTNQESAVWRLGLEYNTDDSELILALWANIIYLPTIIWFMISTIDTYNPLLIQFVKAESRLTVLVKNESKMPNSVFTPLH